MAKPRSFFTLLVLLLIANLATARTGFFGSAEKDEHGNYGTSEDVREHVKQHLEAQKAKNQVPFAVPDNADEELMYLFKFHDFDGNGKLDGHELIFALTDWDGEEGGRNRGVTTPLHEIEKMIEHILEEDDEDNDNMISIQEYLKSAAYHENK